MHAWTKSELSLACRIAPFAFFSFFHDAKPTDSYFKSPYFLQVSHLQSQREAIMGVVARAPTLRHLRRLKVGFGGVASAEMKALADSPHITRLEELTLNCCFIGFHGFKPLCEAENLGHLTRLELRSNQIANGAMKHFAMAPWTRSLQYLDLSENPITGKGVEALNDLDLSQLEELWLQGNRIGSRGLTALSALQHISKIKNLQLRANGIQEQGVEVFARSPAIKNLTRLDLSYNPIRDGGLIALAESPHLGNLRELSLDDTGVGQRGMEALASTPSIAHLTTLRLSNTLMGDEGAVALANAPILKHVTHLSLFNSQIGTRGVLALANSPYLQNIHTLNLHENDISDESARALITSPVLADINVLTFDVAGLSERTCQLIAQSPHAYLLAESE